MCEPHSAKLRKPRRAAHNTWRSFTEGASKAMETAPSWTPDLETLSAGLTAVLELHSPNVCRVMVRDRHPNIYASSTPTEIVTCAFGDGTERKLLCKYSSGDAYTGHGHWGG